MGIYISGVKGLPEQVQENKENIKDIQEEIEGIDWDAIHNLENQVAENTQDINNMEGTIGTQNIAITQLGGRLDTVEPKVSALEDKTEAITRDSDNDITQVGEDLNVEGNISLGDTKSIILGNDGHNSIESSGNGNSYIDFDGLDNPEVVSDGNIYKFTDTGITLNGTPTGTKYYYHNVSFSYSSNYVSLGIISTDNTEINTLALLKTAVEKFSGDTSVIRHKPLMCNLFVQGNPASYNSGCIYSNGTNVVFCKSGATSWNEYVVSTATVSDIVFEL